MGAWQGNWQKSKVCFNTQLNWPFHLILFFRVVVVKEPEFRPRGMGLGVERKKPPKRNNDEASDLKMCKGAYVRAFQGPLQGCYGKV